MLARRFPHYIKYQKHPTDIKKYPLDCQLERIQRTTNLRFDQLIGTFSRRWFCTCKSEVQVPGGRPARQRRYPTLGFFRAAKAHPGPMRVFRGMGAGADATQGCRAAAAGRQGRVSGNKSRGTACKTAPGSNTWCTAPAPGAVGCAFNNARIELKIGASCSHGDSPTI